MSFAIWKIRAQPCGWLTGDRMTTNVLMKSRIAELSEVERRLWNAFKVAEKEYIPPVFNPYKVSVNLYRLWREGRIRFYEYYPVYGLIAVAFAGGAILGHWWLFVGYLAFLAVSGLYLNKYVKQFAFQKTQIHGLERYSFGVPHLPLLVHGMSRVLSEKRSVGDTARSSEPLTKDALGSIIKLVKGGHEHGEIGYGFDDAIKKWLYAAVVGAISAGYAHAGEVSSGVAKAWKVVAGNWMMTAAVVGFIFGTSVMLHGLFFSPANEKRRKRRYLLALNTIYETWPGE